jgi:hypothetical protein
MEQPNVFIAISHHWTPIICMKGAPNANRVPQGQD